MILDLGALPPREVYAALIQTVIPRPIAWVLSQSPAGHLNLAPFSFFNVVSSRPPLVAISVGSRPEGGPKDTRANIERTEVFVVHVAQRDMLRAINDSSAPLPAEQSEVEQLGLATVPFEGSPLPRLRDCRVAFACRHERIVDLVGPQALILGRVERIHVDDAIVERDGKGRLQIRAERIDPVARLGGDDYAMLGPIESLARPLADTRSAAPKLRDSAVET